MCSARYDVRLKPGPQWRVILHLHLPGIVPGAPGSVKIVFCCNRGREIVYWPGRVWLDGPLKPESVAAAATLVLIPCFIIA